MALVFVVPKLSAPEKEEKQPASMFSDEDLEFVRAQKEQLGLSKDDTEEVLGKQELDTRESVAEESGEHEEEDGSGEQEEEDGSGEQEDRPSSDHITADRSRVAEGRLPVSGRKMKLDPTLQQSVSRSPIQFQEVIPISSVAGTGLEKLYIALKRVVQKAKAQAESRTITLSADAMRRA